jgi:hypothetical protein
LLWFRDHTQLDKPHSVGLLWTSDQPDNTQDSQEIHAPGGIRTHNPSKRVAADLRLDHAATGIGMASYTDLKIGFY